MGNSTNIFTKEKYREYLLTLLERIENTRRELLCNSDCIKLDELHFNIAKELYKLDNERS